MKAEEFENRFCEVQKQNEASLKDTEESHSKLCQLQEMIERLAYALVIFSIYHPLFM